LNQSALAFPTLEVFHILGFATAIGTIALVDLRMLGVGLVGRSPLQLQRDTGVWTFAALAVAIVSGLLLFSTDPDMYYLNLSFVVKLFCLIVAIIWQYTIRRKAAASGTSFITPGLVAILSLLLWSSVIFGGIFIGFVDIGLSLGGRR
jgi:hypothetical protein